MKTFLLTIALYFWGANLSAATTNLYNLTLDDVDAISIEFATNFMHTTLSPASTLGRVFGFEIGVMGGMTDTPAIKKVTNKINSNSAVAKIPTAGIIGVVSIPFGISVEGNFIPKVTSHSNSIYNGSIGLKWTPTIMLPTATFDLAIRLHANSGEFSYSGIVNNTSTGNQNVETSTSWKNRSYGYNLELSKKLLFIEPYAGFGQVKTNSKIGVQANSSVSIFTFSSAREFQIGHSGTHLYGGINLNLFVLKIGAEYAKIMGVAKYTGKVSWYF